MKLRWTPEAIQDRDGVCDYIQAGNPSAVLALDEKFSERARHLSQLHPLFRPDNTLAEYRIQYLDPNRGKPKVEEVQKILSTGPERIDDRQVFDALSIL